MASPLIAIDFEVFGVVQGVFFRVHTQKQAKMLGLYGWVQNTSRDTVIGTIEGPPAKVNEMKDWLTHTGSPTSQIDKAVFTNEHPIAELTVTDFEIRRGR